MAQFLVFSAVNALATVLLTLDRRSHFGAHHGLPADLLRLSLDITEEEWGEVIRLGLDLDVISVNSLNLVISLTENGKEKAREIGKILSN